MYPRNIEEAVEALKDYYGDDLLETVAELTEAEFLTLSHFGMGMFIRNTWALWWQENHHEESWPKEKPALVQYFHERGVIHPDDMSHYILVATYKAVKGEMPTD